MERLYAISESIRREAPRPVSAARLAEQFDVSRRTIERDLASLRAAGMPLYGERGRSGGQRRLEPPPGLDPSRRVVLTLSAPEIAALAIAVAAAGDGMPFTEDGRSAIASLLDGLADTTRLTVEELRSRIRTSTQTSVDPRPGFESATDAEPDSGSAFGARPSKQVGRTLSEAVRRGVVVNLDYIDRHGRTTSRSVEAVGFYQGGDGWYLIGWCRLRDGGRIFRTDRVTKARLTRTTFDARDVDETLGWVPKELAVP